MALACLIVLVFALVACSEDDPPKTERPTLEAVGPPAVTMSSGNMSVTMGIGSSCWRGPGAAACIDKVGIITPAQPFSVSAGAPVRIDHPIPGSAIEATVSAFPATGQPAQAGVELAWMPAPNPMTLRSFAGPDGVRFAADLAPGRYVLSAFLVVTNGDVTYGALLEVR